MVVPEASNQNFLLSLDNSFSVDDSLSFVDDSRSEAFMHSRQKEDSHFGVFTVIRHTAVH